VNDFVTYGLLSTDIGTLQTDLHMKVPDKGPANYEGRVSTNNFQLGKFIDNNQMGAVAFDGKIKGKGFSENDIDLAIDGNISKLDFNNYIYSNIIAHGDIRKTLFTGYASIDDPHIKIDTLIGSINFSKSSPKFDLRSEEHTSELQSRENLVCRL